MIFDIAISALFAWTAWMIIKYCIMEPYFSIKKRREDDANWPELQEALKRGQRKREDLEIYNLIGSDDWRRR